VTVTDVISHHKHPDVDAVLLLIVTTHVAILSFLFSRSPYFVLLHFCIFYYCDISYSCVWQLGFYRNEM